MEDTLKNEIRQALIGLSADSPVLREKARVDKLYEIFIFTCVLKALENIGATSIQIKDSNNVTSNVLYFRMGPAASTNLSAY